MASMMRLLLLLAPLVRLSVGISPEELESFFASPSGLGMGLRDALVLAEKEAPTATQCGVNVTGLKALKSVLYNPTGVDLSMKDLRAKLLPLAYAHVDPAALTSLWSALYGIGPGSLNLPRAAAQERVVALALQGTAGSELKLLFKALYDPRGANLPLKDAQAEATELAAAGADPDELRAAFLRARRSGLPVADSLRDAERAAVAKDADGLGRRYAKDNALPYNAEGFQCHYGANWLVVWLAAPREKRLARDSKAYSAAEFRDFFGASWRAAFEAGAVATQRRLARDGAAYTIQEFKDHYSDSWQDRWAVAPEVPCAECKPFLAAAFDLVV